MKPKVSLLWINYNSSHFIDLALESLQAVKDIDYPNYELIIVDNGSTDNSMKTIKDFINRNQIESKIIELDRNLGFTGGNNVAYSKRDVSSKYVALLNNDAVPQKQSLTKLVDSIEEAEILAGVQGVILEYDGKSIHTAGNFLSETFSIPALLSGKSPNSLKREMYITAADGAYSLYRVQAVNKMMQQTDKMFDNFVFACYDDFTLGLNLWNQGFKIKALPIIVAKHARGSTIKRGKRILAYLFTRNRIVLNEISNSRYKNHIRVNILKELLVRSLLVLVGIRNKKEHMTASRIFNRAVIDGIRLSGFQKRLGKKIDIYRAPSVLIGSRSVLLWLAVGHRHTDFCVKRQMEHIEHLANSETNGKD